MWGGGEEFWGRPDDHEHADDPWGEEEVEADGVEVLALDGFKIEDAFEEVGGGDEDEGEEGEEPEGEVDVRGNVEEFGGWVCGEGEPEDGLAA